MDQEDIKLIVSPTDHRTYKLVTLPNLAQVLLISDPKIVMSYCAISVGIGNFSDPNQSLGLAHFFEHMIFMGSSKYPAFNDYSSFISMNSGYENAETNDTSTTFYFQIASPALEEAMDRTCDALKSPLFSESCIEKQIQAIEEEFVLMANDDDTRFYEVLREYGTETFRRFSMGNKKTLQHPHIKDHLIGFYKTFYSSDLMSFVVMGPMSIEQMMEKSVKYIMQIPNKSLRESPLMSPYRQRCFNANTSGQIPFFKIHSVKNQTSLKFVWIIPNVNSTQLYQQHLKSYLKYILESGASNSLSNLLNQHNLGSEIELQFENLGDTQTMMTLEVCEALGDEDENSSDAKIATIVHKTLSVILLYLREVLSAPNQVVFAELEYIKEMNFNNREIEDMQDYICELAQLLQKGQCKKEHLIAHDAVKAPFSAQVVRDFLLEINNVSNIMVVLGLPKLMSSNKKMEKYLQIQYILNFLPNSIEKTINHIPSTYKQLPRNTLIPNVNQHIKTNSQIPQPKRMQNIHFFNPIANRFCKGGIKLFLHNNEAYTFNLLFVEFMNLLLQDVDGIVDAQAIYLQNNFQYENGRLLMYLFGYDHLVLTFLIKIAQHFQQLVNEAQAKNDEELWDMFDEAKESLEEDIDFYYEDEMDDLADKIRDQMLIQTSPQLKVINEELKKIKKNKFIERASKMWRQSVMEWVIVGNFDHNQVLFSCKKFEEIMKNQSGLILSEAQGELRVRQTKIICLDQLGKNLKYEVRLKEQKIATSTCLIYLEAGPYSEQLHAQLMILENYIDEPFFSELRTEKKLAYDLQIRIVNTRGILGICFLLISSKIDPETISENLHQFIARFFNPDTIFQRLSSEDGFFEKLKRSVIVKESESFQTIDDLFEFICEEVINRTFKFDRKDYDKLEKLISIVSAEEIAILAERMRKNGSAEVLIVSKKHKAAYSQKKKKVMPLSEIKEKTPYYEDKLANLRYSEKS